MNTDEKITIESIQFVVKKFQKVGFEGLKLEDLAIAVAVPEFKDQFLKQTGLDWMHKYEQKALERLRKAHFDMQWMSNQIREEFNQLFVFVQKGDLEKTKQFLKNYNDMELAKQAVDQFNRSPLHVACKEGHTSIVEYLLLQGFSVFARDKSLKTPLHYAAYHGQEYICEQLVKKGAFIDSTDTKGRTAFHYACCGNSAKIIVLFIGICPEIIESQDINQLTGLHYSILNSSLKQIDIVRTLIEFGAKVNSRDKEGKTPLYYAAEQGRTRVIPILMQKGADITLANYENHKTPLDVAVNEHTRELLIVYSSAASGVGTKKEDIQWMNEAIKGQGLGVVEVPFREKGDTNASSQAKKSRKGQKLNEEKGTIQGWARERFFDMMKKVQEEGVKVNQHLKKPFIYTGSWMENITNVEDLYNLLQGLTSTEACLCVFNILCPYDKPLPQEEEKEVIDNFYGDAWQISIKKPMEDRLRKELEIQEKLQKFEDFEMKLDYKDKLLKDKIEELKKLREENMDLKVKVQELDGVSNKDGMNSEQVEELQQEVNRLKQELKEKSRLLVEKDMELELIKMEGGGGGASGGIGKSTLDQEGQEAMKELIKLKEELRLIKIEQKMQRFKTGQIFVKALSEAKRAKGKKEVDNMNVEILQDDEAIIRMYMSLKNNPPNFIQRLKEVDKDGDNKITQSEFVKYCSNLSLSSSDIGCLQRVAGFYQGKKLLGIAEFKTILENRPKQRQIWEEQLFKKVIDSINSKKIPLEKFFEFLDTDGSGEISPSEMRERFEALKITLNQKDFNSFYCIFDKEKVGSISIQELKSTLENYLDKSQIHEEDEEEEHQQEEEEEQQDGSQKRQPNGPDNNPLCKVENKLFLQEEVDINDEYDQIDGSLKLQLPTLRNIDPKYKNIFLKISLQGSIENQIVHQTQIYSSFIKVAQKFRFRQANTQQLSRYISIKIFFSQQMDEESYLGEVHFAWKGCLRDPNQWHCNQEFTLLNLSYPKKTVQGFLAVQARFIPQMLQDNQNERPDTAVQEIDENIGNNNNANKQSSDLQKDYIEQQKKYMELQEKFIKQQEEMLKLQKSQQNQKPPLISKNSQSKSQSANIQNSNKITSKPSSNKIDADIDLDGISSNIDDLLGDSYLDQLEIQKIDSNIDNIIKTKQNKTSNKSQNKIGQTQNKSNATKQSISSQKKIKTQINDVSSNIDDILADSDLANQSNLQKIDSNIDNLIKSKPKLNTSQQSGIMGQDASIHNINRSILNQIDDNYDQDLSPVKQVSKRQYSKNFNKNLDQLIHSMNSDIDQLINNSEIGYNQDDLEQIDSNVDLSQIDVKK
ncbi:EF hand protein (macronuclear) [Tetrahymena thermophila SB210]|uniref:EF hand protein n=1 Tax=Tetrahymena thermophila (strain SB210) TaxID=312017 RepID=I7MCR7_TETTS|nr:EF hand protein [Tetrahymena thermophila SB210]EAR84800.2 EF hand protein [Tetrahymena thermophila SB210]|eukprot:XP_001032463.2 EF hand protein [Tetrahymena thermophila SB210]